MSLSTSFHSQVTTPIPPEIDHLAIIKALRDHDFLITMQPVVTRHEVRDRDPATGQIIYDVWEKIGLLPFGLWKYELQFTTAFTDKKDSLVSWVKAPMGLTSEAHYTVKPGGHGEGEVGGWVLDESIETTCPIFFKWFVESRMVDVRRRMHGQIINTIRARGKNEGEGGTAG